MLFDTFIQLIFITSLSTVKISASKNNQKNIFVVDYGVECILLSSHGIEDEETDIDPNIFDIVQTLDTIK
jgi:hypothetical protein